MEVVEKDRQMKKQILTGYLSTDKNKLFNNLFFSSPELRLCSNEVMFFGDEHNVKNLFVSLNVNFKNDFCVLMIIFLENIRFLTRMQ